MPGRSLRMRSNAARTLGEIGTSDSRRAVPLCVVLLACSGSDTVGPEPPVLVPTTISLSETSLSFASLGDTRQLQATVRDQNGKAMTGVAVARASSDGSVATVSGNGLVTPVVHGSATITAVIQAASATASVSVSQVASSISVDPGSLEFWAFGYSKALASTVLDAGGSEIPGPVPG